MKSKYPERCSLMNSITMNPVSFKGTAESSEAEKKNPLSSQDIQERTDEFTKTVNTVADGVEKTADSVVGASTKVAGSIAAIKVGFTKLIPKPILEFFTKNGTEKIIDKETGQEVFKKVANWKHIGIVAGAAALLATGVTVYKGIKNNIEHKQKMELLNAQKEIVTEKNKNEAIKEATKVDEAEETEE